MKVINIPSPYIVDKNDHQWQHYCYYLSKKLKFKSLYPNQYNHFTKAKISYNWAVSLFFLSNNFSGPLDTLN